MATLHLLTGPWGSGKTTLIPHLARRLPGVVVFDWDVLLAGLSQAAGKDAHSDPSTWEGLRMMWVSIVCSVLAGNRDVLLCGPCRPSDFAAAGIAPGSIRCAYLDCPDEVLAARLRNRGETEDDIADELATMAELRGSSHVPLHAGGASPQRLAEEIAAWIELRG